MKLDIEEHKQQLFSIEEFKKKSKELRDPKKIWISKKD